MASQSSITAQWAEENFWIKERFSRPDWEKIYEYIGKNITESDMDTSWQAFSKVWMNKVIEELGGAYALYESPNFILVTAQNDTYHKNLLAFLEQSLSRILKYLEGIASDEGYGKHIAIVFDQYEDYYSYISYFYPEGEHSISSGVYLNKGYGHFALPYQDLDQVEPVVAHELTHACLAHLPIPLWLNEGLAVTLENDLTGSWPLRMDNEQFIKHKKFWNREIVQQFWSGESFGRTDQGNSLSYELARFAIKSLSHNYKEFQNFALKADYKDGGEAAALESFGGSLGGLIEQFFGPGDWIPQPQTWDINSEV